MVKNRKILVTGSSDGIGRSISKYLLNEGAKVIGIARNHEKFDPTSDNYFKYNVDVSNMEVLPKKISSIIKDHKDIDGFVSNAGFGKFGNIETFSSKEISNYIFTNLSSHIIITNKLLPHLKSINKGNIIYIGSESLLSKEVRMGAFIPRLSLV